MTKKPTYEELEKRVQELEQVASMSKKAEEMLQMSKDYLSNIINAIGEPVFVKDDEFRFVLANDSLCEILGIERENIIGKTLGESLPDNQMKHFLKIDKLVLESGQDNLCEEILTGRDGNILTIVTKKTRYVDEQGRRFIVGTIRDITESKQAELELSAAHTKLQMLWGVATLSDTNIKTISDYIIASITQMSESPYGFYGLVNEDESVMTIHTWYGEVMKNCSMVDKPQQYPVCQSGVWAEAIRRREPFIMNEYATPHKAKMGLPEGHLALTRILVVPYFSQGKIRAVAAVANRATDYGQEDIAAIEGFLGSVQAIADRKQAEEALRESEEKYRHLIEKLDDIIWTVDINLNATYMSPSIEKNLGFTPKERMIQNLSDQMTPSSYQNIAELLIKELNREKEPGVNPNRSVRVEIEYYHKNGSTLWFENIISGLRDKNGILCGFHGVARDISERKVAEKEKIKAQEIAGEQEKLALVGQVAGKMAHDFNNILGIIMGNTELTLLDCQEPETRKTLELIFEQTIRGKNLTKNLVAFARDQEPKQEFFRISEKIDLVLNLMRKDLEGIELRKEESQGVPELLADPGMIEHALVNLIQNSIHALSMVEHPRITLRTYRLDNKICFEIEDNGCGISKENLENIYELSFTLKGSRDVTGSYKSGIKGTGYGMANVKKYVEQHKGSISIESEVGVGATFTICLPIIKKELTTKEKTELKKEITQFEKYILLVEDETAISDVQYRILTSEPCNHKVDVAHNGQMAKDLFERNIYDFVSLDYVLPGGINGMDVYHHIRKTNQTVPVLFISGNIEFLESIKELKQKDAYIDHLSKPCQNKDYVNGINELLEKTLAEQQ